MCHRRPPAFQRGILLTETLNRSLLDLTASAHCSTQRAARYDHGCLHARVHRDGGPLGGLDRTPGTTRRVTRDRNVGRLPARLRACSSGGVCCRRCDPGRPCRSRSSDSTTRRVEVGAPRSCIVDRTRPCVRQSNIAIKRARRADQSADTSLSFWRSGWSGSRYLLQQRVASPEHVAHARPVSRRARASELRYRVS